MKDSSEKEPIVIKNILIHGTGKKIKINALDVAIGTEKLTGGGHLAVENKNLQLDIDLISSFLSKKSLNNLTQGLKETAHDFINDQADRDDEEPMQKDWDITGRIGFDFDSFSTSRKTTTLYT